MAPKGRLLPVTTAKAVVSLGQIADIAIKRYFWCGMLI
jgi:hypothetical protein